MVHEILNFIECRAAETLRSNTPESDFMSYPDKNSPGLSEKIRTAYGGKSVRAHLVIIILPLFSCSQSQPDVDKSKFYLRADSSLYLSRTDERNIDTCTPPESGAFITVSYWHEGEWLKEILSLRSNSCGKVIG